MSNKLPQLYGTLCHGTFTVLYGTAHSFTALRPPGILGIHEVPDIYLHKGAEAMYLALIFEKI